MEQTLTKLAISHDLLILLGRRGGGAICVTNTHTKPMCETQLRSTVSRGLGKHSNCRRSTVHCGEIDKQRG